MVTLRSPAITVGLCVCVDVAGNRKLLNRTQQHSHRPRFGGNAVQLRAGRRFCFLGRHSLTRCSRFPLVQSIEFVR